MGPVLADAATFPGLTAHELTAAQLAFQRLLEKLSQKHRMAADGRDVAQWVRGRASELIVGVEKLKAHLKACKEQQQRFE